MADPLVVQARNKFTRNRNQIFKFTKFCQDLQEEEYYNESYPVPICQVATFFLLFSRYNRVSTRFVSKDFIISQLTLPVWAPEDINVMNEMIEGTLQRVGQQNEQGLWSAQDFFLSRYTYCSAEEALSDRDIKKNYLMLKKAKRRIRSLQEERLEILTNTTSTLDVDITSVTPEDLNSSIRLQEDETVQELIRRDNEQSFILENQDEDDNISQQEEDQIRQAEQASFDEIIPFTPHVPKKAVSTLPDSTASSNLREKVKRKFQELDKVLLKTEDIFSFFMDTNEKAKEREIDINLCPSDDTKESWQKDFQRILQDVSTSLETHFNYQQPKILSECSICQEYLNNAQVLDCGHLLCLDCILNPDFKKFRSGNADKIICPLCKKKGFFHQIYV